MDVKTSLLWDLLISFAEKQLVPLSETELRYSVLADFKYREEGFPISVPSSVG